MNFAEIIGQEDVKSLLKNAIKSGNTSHAYIFSGESGSGKMMLAEAFASMLLCENPSNEDSCGQCHSCKQAIGRNNPDIIYITHDEDKKNIGVDIIREKINNDIILKPYASKYKVYIVDEAERMNPQAQNALLKTIEEPPAYAVLILLTSNHNGLLQTILSRCVTVQMKPIGKNLIKSYLQEKLKIVDYQAEIVASFAQGNLGKAIELSQSEEFNQMKTDVLRLVKKVSNIEEYEISEEIKLFETYKLKMNEILDLIVLWFRDVLLYKSTRNESFLLFKDDFFDIKQQALNTSYNGIDEILAAIDLARKRLESNVNFDLTMQLLIEGMKENSK